MAQAKRKTATKTAKKTTARKTTCRKKSCSRTTKCRDITNKERVHIYIVTAMAIIAGILLCADAAMMMV
ncbi:hypothetical protein IKE82_02210 [Candidatus Saccharibacteria bacterium]|nr:hypothetical protein [Candidatus Saccharibacteria bacterium]